MTLIVSCLSPDGIVIAGDSLSTITGRKEFKTTFSYAQKVFPFCNKFGVGTFGQGVIAGKSIYFEMRLFEQLVNENAVCFGRVTEAAKAIGNHFQRLLNASIEDLAANQFPLGFYVVGYDDTNPKTIRIDIGGEISYNVYTDSCACAGSVELAQTIWDFDNKDERRWVPYESFSLQDAIDYVEFMINTTATHQRFSQTIPNVGGAIDIARVTPFDGFQWIRQKHLGK